MSVGYGWEKDSSGYGWECFNVLAKKHKNRKHQKTRERNESFSPYVSFSYFQLMDLEVLKLFCLFVLAIAVWCPWGMSLALRWRMCQGQHFRYSHKWGRSSVTSAAFDTELQFPNCCMFRKCNWADKARCQLFQLCTNIFYSQYIFFSDYKNNTCPC